MGLIARALESSGLPTVSMSVMLDITRLVKPPRAVFLDFPPGHTSGAPFDHALQDAIVRDALGALVTVETSGTILRLPYAWPGGDGWKASPLPDRLPRHETPQFQCDADRAAAETHDAGVCPVCVVGWAPATLAIGRRSRTAAEKEA